MNTNKLCALSLVVVLAVPALAESWPQFRGPDRTDISQETGLMKEWPAEGPKQLWVFSDTGLGYSGPSVVGDTLYIMGARGEAEYLFAFNVQDGTQKWATEIGGLLTNNWGDGPRGTPTVAGEHIYTLSAKGNLVCAQTADGKIVWQKTMRDFGGGQPNWGYCESPLVDGDKVVCTPGGKQGAIVALDKTTGELAWQSKDFTEGAQYASIIVANHNGKRQYIQLTQKKVAGVNADSGELLWQSDWHGSTAVIPTPIFSDGCVYITSGYGAGCKLVKLDSDQTTDVYDNKVMKNHHGGVILLGEYLYGYSDGAGWVCQNFKTGEMVWNEKSKFGKGCLTCVDGMLYLMSENDGQVVLIDASPGGWTEHGRFKLTPQTEQRKPSGKIWTHPVVADGRLYLRDQEFLSCYDVRAK